MQAIFETLFDAVYLTTVITLGIGKLITSITMMLFYVLLYYVWRCRYEINDRSCSGCADSCFVLQKRQKEE